MEKVVNDLSKRLEYCTVKDIPELRKLSDDFHDLLIEYVVLLRKHGMKTKLTKTWADLISEPCWVEGQGGGR